MRLAALGLLLLVAGCETSERAAWQAHLAERERRLAELHALAADPALRERASAVSTGLAALRGELDLAQFLRTTEAGGTVRGEGEVLSVASRGTVEACEVTLAALAPRRWLLETWRLRLHEGRCDWSARTGPAYRALLAQLDAPPRVPWSPPPRSLFSRGIDELQRHAQDAEHRVEELERALGPLALAQSLQASFTEASRQVDTLKARPAPCDLAILRRELALDTPSRGRLLEVESGKLVQPLEPLNDLRLRGLVQQEAAGPLAWRCEAP